jgi:hypothetical protein
VGRGPTRADGDVAFELDILADDGFRMDCKFVTSALNMALFPYHRQKKPLCKHWGHGRLTSVRCKSLQDEVTAMVGHKILNNPGDVTLTDSHASRCELNRYTQDLAQE